MPGTGWVRPGNTCVTRGKGLILWGIVGGVKGLLGGAGNVFSIGWSDHRVAQSSILAKGTSG